MIKIVATLLLSIASLCAFSQYYTGYYVSAPSVHSFDHFKIKQDKNEHSKLEGDLAIHAFITKKNEIWDLSASYVADDNRRNFLTKEYGDDKNIISVHLLKFLWDGNEYEYILLGYIGDDRHRHFVVVEEIFNDETETELLELNKFDWVKAHHIKDEKVMAKLSEQDN